MRNLLTQLKEILGAPPFQVGEVVSTTGGVTVELPGGALIAVIGQATVGDKVFVRGGVIEGPAPDLPTYTIDV